MIVDDLAPFDRRQLGPRPTEWVGCVGGRAGAGVQLGDQLVDRAGLVGQPVVPGVEDLQEDPLRPAVVLGIGSGNRAPVVVAQAQPTQLRAEDLHVGFGGRARVLSGLQRVLLGGQPERVKSHCVQDVRAAHSQVARVDVGAYVTQRVPDVQTGAGRIREHVEHVGLRTDRHPVETVSQLATWIGRVEGALALPTVLPGRLDLVGQRAAVAVRRRVVAGRRTLGGHRIPLDSNSTRTCKEPLRIAEAQPRWREIAVSAAR